MRAAELRRYLSESIIPAMQINLKNTSRLLAGLTLVLLLLAAGRGMAMWAHQPLVALANNFDQVRYTACLDIYPYRPGVAPDRNSYETPLEYFSAQSVPDQACYWTSELLFIAPVALLARSKSTTGDTAVVSVRWAGALHLVVWLLSGAAFSWLWWRAEQSELACANAAFLALIAMDPGNTIYLNTFYAEASALMFLYSTVCLTLLMAQQPRRGLAIWLTISAFLLGMSKFQHLLLPLLLAMLTWAVAAIKHQPWRRAVLALGIGGAIALCLQLVNSQRDNSLNSNINLVNRTDAVLSAVLPASADPALTAQRLGLAADCANFRGKSIYQLHADPEKVCPGISAVGPSRVLGLLSSEPGTLARMFADAPCSMLPWIPDYLGLVGDTKLAPLPAEFFSFDRLLKAPWMPYILLLLPLLAVVPLTLVARRGDSPVVLLFAVMCGATAWSCLLIAILGDGLVEIAKHSHLAFTAGFAFVLCVPLVWLLRQLRGARA
ncbi:hypothetical protein ELE36_19955 [Pseudolysobacter antarcticus]|uniref:Glycosyltransferase RgtA/B/C/D-like domain-containing protein n=1 Tax=Pseudolysobacter antarcticus TaxID=2511995 RepID=A0A411HPQ3_9GAMM|nr:hypothetical protein [Pseudolysobacter antarcticus]QBB72455.1 hypothetical protein ELE36_19955 [Pseudolysobacter antarcticus]